MGGRWHDGRHNVIRASHEVIFCTSDLCFLLSKLQHAPDFILLIICFFIASAPRVAQLVDTPELCTFYQSRISKISVLDSTRENGIPHFLHKRGTIYCGETGVHISAFTWRNRRLPSPTRINSFLRLSFCPSVRAKRGIWSKRVLIRKIGKFSFSVR
jgi:hypothetical protein